jgi:putative transposase
MCSGLDPRLEDGRPAVPSMRFSGAHLLRKNRRRRRWAHPDFKGQFKTGDGQYCYPLTITDHFSRRLLVCQRLSSVKTAETQLVFRTLFRTVGLPEAIRTDNGSPFASTGFTGCPR